MRVGLVNQPQTTLTFPVKEGSIAIWTYEVARRLAASCEVHVYTKKGPGQDEFQVHEGVRYHRISTNLDDRSRRLLNDHPRIERLPGLRNPKRPFFNSILANPEYALHVALALRRDRCDVIHIANFSDLVPVIRALNPRSRIVLHMQCEWLNQLDRKVIRRRVAKVDSIVGCSEYISNKFRAAFPEFASRCHTIYNGADVDAFTSDGTPAPAPDGPKQVLFLGRSSPEKGLHVLLEAFAKVAVEHTDAQLQIVGPAGVAPLQFIVRLADDPIVRELERYYHGNYSSDLKKLSSVCMPGRVVFVGNLPYPNVADCYRRASLFVVPSVCNEAFPLVVPEAMAAGVPVVATRVGGVPEIVEDRKTGLLVERGDASALADAISLLLEDNALRQSLGQAGRQRVLQDFSWDKIAQDSLRHYNELVAVEKRPKA